MKTKLVLWGTNDQDERVLIALELRAQDNKVNIYTFPEEVATEEFCEKLMNIWRDGKEVPFPENHTKSETELRISENILPENLKVERGDLIHRAQTEWHFVVLSSKLHQAYENELGELRDRLNQRNKFDQQLWEELKTFWNKVQSQVREKNLFREHANTLRDNTNKLFARLKELRSKLDEEFHKLSKDNHDDFMSALERIEQKITDGLRLQAIFDDLKGLQRKFRDSKLTREHRAKVWERLDGAFKTVKKKRFGSSGDARSPLERLKRRYDGLISAIEKMERSIKRDQDDLDFQNRKIASTDGQLEAQIRQAKILMIKERIRSKEEKLGEMLQTKIELERRIETQKNKEARRLEKEKLEKAKREAQEKIAKEIQAAAASRESEAEKLEKAAEAIVQPKRDPETEEPSAKEKTAEKEEEQQEEAKEDNLLQSVSTSVKESIEDMVDTVKAVKEVASDRIEEKVEELKDKLADEKSPLGGMVEKVKSAAETVGDQVEEKVEELKEQFAEEKEVLTNVAKKVKSVAETVSDQVEEKVEELKSKFAGEKKEEQKKRSETPPASSSQEEE